MSFKITNPAALAEIEKAKERTRKLNKAQWNKKDYESKKGEYIKRSATRYARMTAILFEAKDKPCTDCGVQLPPECMDLDHVRGEKLFSPGAWSNSPKVEGKTKEDLLREEIAKCEVRCPNCHRLRHYEAKYAKRLEVSASKISCSE